MTSLMFKEQFPDCRDPKNETGDCPGYRIYVEETDGYVLVGLQPVDKNEISSEDAYTAALTASETEKLIEGLQDAIKRAKPKRP